MSSVGSLSSSTSSSIFNSSNRITGLASGLDTDALIESMTAATRAKIAKQNQDKQLLQWKMDDYRSITSKLIDFQNKYLSYSSETNLRSPNFFDKTLLSVLGNNSKYVSVSGTSKTVENIAISAVEQLAQNTTYISSSAVSDNTLNGSEVNGNKEYISSKLEGTYISFSYQDKNYTVSLPASEVDENPYKSADDIVNALNKELGEIDSTDGEKLSDKVKFEVVDGKINFKETTVNGYKMEIKGGSDELLNVIGFKKGDSTSTGVIEGKNQVTEDILTGEGYQITNTIKDMVAGKTLTFTYNGVTKKINLPDAEKNADLFNADGSAKMDKLAEYLEKELGKAFGAGRIDVNFKDNGENKGIGSFEFKTTLVGGGDDASSILKLNSGDADALKALGLKSGDSNRLNLTSPVAESGLKDISGFSGLKDGTDSTGQNDYVILIKNSVGEIIEISETVGGTKFNAETSLADIIEAINAKTDANVEVTYSEVSDKFTLTSKDPGASGEFSIIGGYLDSDGKVIEGNGTNLGTAIFGTGVNPDEKTGYTYTEGKDAVIWVDYDGVDGAGDPVKITRPTNTFDIDGLSITVNGIFGNVKEENGKITEYDKDAVVTFGAKVDTEKVTEAVKTMIDAFNEIIKLTNDEVSEKRNRDYAPLTDEQKEEMTEDQIKAWEEKAKAGMLFNDSDLKSFTSSIRFIFSGDSETMKLLSDMGITTSTNYEDHGKIKFDESKFKAALEENPDAISDLFTRAGKTTVDSEGNTVTEGAGLMNQIKTVFDKYASTTGSTKGIFVEIAGATESPLSMLDNNILDQMDDIDDEIEKLQDKLEMETERYYKQFTSLETFISQMNSQSSWLASQFA